MSILDKPEVLKLQEYIIEKVKLNPLPPNCGPIAVMSWMSRNVSQEQFALLEKIEVAIGEDEATQWMMLLLGSTDAVKMDA